ncbi:mitochondrial carnitine/acylcarnitine carrier protein-like [Dermatophagoides pteronyssinus]|uniref:Uncharacterized protein n=2 Tax=Dermatophagoides pteronyssinus TaxID=6956 RepID=A0ABQ8IT49_DERPT|nr:mitochondrial carnitine/acylcarnitine carrier protein-like [Dermatophagoides pteronyssinus]KAH9413498.1 hypothetical protein DERP_007976 [Dermatophagoides pteronyssinus]
MANPKKQLECHEYDHKPKQISTIKNFFAGGFGGICLVAAGHPLDTVKVRMQTMSLTSNAQIASTPSMTSAQQIPHYSGTWDCVRKIFTDEGVRGFYKGMATPLVGVTPLYSVCFFGYSLGKKLQNPVDGYHHSAMQIFNAGMLSSVFTNLITTPGERIKCLLQIQQASGNKPLFNGPIDCAFKLYRDGGLRSLYRGTIATLCRDVPAGGAYFVTYELLQRHLILHHSTNDQHSSQQQQQEHGLGVWRTLFAGGMSGIVFWCFALPADVIKSRLQTAPTNLYPNGMRDVIREIIAKEGIGGFYRGAIAVFLRAFPANAACFFGYEIAMKVIDLIAPDL